ncbi:MAG: hypothetical protein WCY82_01465 [Desulfotomaculaceae bacterium]
MQSIECIVKVDIATGQVLENNVRAFWDTQARGKDIPNPAWRSNPAMQNNINMQVSEELLAVRIKKFNSARRRRTKNAWTDTEVHRLAVLIGIHKQKPYQAASWVDRTPRACQRMLRQMKIAGVI